MKHLNCKLYYQQLLLKYLCNLARYWLQAVWRWHDSVETCRSVIICEIIVHSLVIVQNKKMLVFIWPTVLQLWRFRDCFIVSCVDVLLQSNYNVRRCACLRRWLSGWHRQDNAGANFALLVVQTNWCLPPPISPPFPSSSCPFPFLSLFYPLTSS